MSVSVNVKTQFGKQLRIYRESAGLTQQEYAQLLKSNQGYIGSLESGNKNVQIETMQHHAAVFGVMFYELANPKNPIPTLEQMPKKLQRYVAQVLKARETKRTQPRQSLAEHLDKLLAGNFLATPRTAANIAAEIKKVYGVTTTSGKVTTLLTKHPRNATVKVVGQPKGRTGSGNWYQLVDVD